MVEMIFVMVILGIVASIGSSIIAKIYESYLYSRSINTLQTKTELAISQIARYLSYRIKYSTIARNSDTDLKTLQDATGDYKILAWIGYNNEGFEGNSSGPGWSGFVDLDSSETNKTQIKTSGSQLLYARDIILALSNDEVNLSESNSSAAIIFGGLPDEFNISQYGWYDGTSGKTHHKYVYRVKNSGNDVLNFIDQNASKVYEHYKLTWSAYALVPTPLNGNDVNLTMYYNFRPWMGEKYSDGSSSTIMEHVSTFKFRQIGTTIRIKLCVSNNPIANDLNTTFCKEEVVF